MGSSLPSGVDLPSHYSSQQTSRAQSMLEHDPLLADEPVDTGRDDALERVNLDAPVHRNGTTTKRNRLNSRTRRRIKTFRTRVKYYIPVLSWLPNYSFSLFGGDLVAGVTLACLLVPQGISYASTLAHLAPVSGLYAAAVPAVTYAFLGTSRQLSNGPEASLSLIVGSTITEILSKVDPHDPKVDTAAISIQVATIMAFQVGLVTTALGLARLGFLDVILSRALLRGFITALGFIITIEQLIPILGLSTLLSQQQPIPSTPLTKAIFLFTHLDRTHGLTAVVGFSSLGFLILMRLIKEPLRKHVWSGVKFIPEILVCVVGVTWLTSQFRWDEAGLAVMGKIETISGSGIGFASPLRPSTLRWFSETFATSCVISVVGFVDSIVAAKQNSELYSYSISPNRELVALGAGNLASSFFPGLIPAFGSITRSRLAGSFGARTQMAGFITGITIFFAIFFLLPSLFFLPKCVLAAIVLLVVFSILQEAPHDIIFYWKMQAWKDFAQLTGTFFLTLLVGIETGLLGSVVMSLIMVVQNSTETRIKILGHLRGRTEWVTVDEADPDELDDIPGVLVVRIREALDFANTGQLKERLRRLELYGPGKVHPSEAPSRPPAEVLVFHMSSVESIDASAIAIFQEIAVSYKTRGVTVFFTHLRPSQKALFVKAGIRDTLGDESFQNSVADAIGLVESRGLSSVIVR